MLASKSDSADEYKTISEEIVAFHESLVQQGIAHDINPSLSLVEQLRQLNGAALSALKRGEQRSIAPDMQNDDWQFRKLAETLPQLIWITLPDGYHIYFNERWYEYTGVNIGDTDGAFWANLLHTDDYVRTLDVWHQCLKTGEPYSIEYRFRNRNGDYRWFLGRAMPARNEKGEIIRWFGTCTDVHEQKLTADELKESQGRLRQSEERLRLAQQVARIGTFERNLKTNASVWSPELEALHGLPDGGFGGKFESWLSLVHPEDREIAAEAALQAVKTGTLEAEWRIIMPNGAVRWVSGRGQIFHDEAGQPHRIVGANLDITRLKAAEEELSRMAAQRQLALDAARLGWWNFDPATKTSTYDSRFQEIFGFTESQSFIEDVAARVHPDDRPRLMPRILAAQNPADPKPYENDYRIILPDGSVRWVESRGKAIFEGEGQNRRVTGVAGTVADITERKQAEARLRESEARYSALFAGNAVAMLLSDPTDSRIVNANMRASAFYGWSVDTLKTMYIRDLNTASSEALQAAYANALQGQSRFLFQHRLASGEVRDVEVFSGPIAIGGRTLLLSSVHDISERKNAEEELRKSNEFADRIMASSLSGLYIFDRKNGKFSFINQKYVLLTGYTPDELLLLTRQNSAIDLFHPDDREKVLAHIESMQSIQSHETREIEYRFKRKDGHWRWFLSREALFSSHPDGSVAEYIGSFIDITERKQAEEDLAASRARLAELSAQLIQAQEQERQKLAWELHDELGQRFTSLQLTLHHLKSLVADKKTEGSWTDAIGEVNTLIQRVRDISHSLRPPLLDYLGLEATVSHLLEQHFAHSGIQFSLEYVGLPEKLPASVEITGYRIIQEGITNISRHANATKVSIEMNGDMEGKELEIVIRDNGAGFDLALIGKSGRPSGIGLNGMRERVGLMGGTFHLASEPGHGTLIEVLLPLEPT